MQWVGHEGCNGRVCGTQQWDMWDVTCRACGVQRHNVMGRVHGTQWVGVWDRTGGACGTGWVGHVGQDGWGMWDRTGGVCGTGQAGCVGQDEQGMWDGTAGHVECEPRDSGASWGVPAGVFGT